MADTKKKKSFLTRMLIKGLDKLDGKRASNAVANAEKAKVKNRKKADDHGDIYPTF